MPTSLPAAVMYPGAPLSELLRASVVYNMLRSDYLVDNSTKVSKTVSTVYHNPG